LQQRLAAKRLDQFVRSETPGQPGRQNDTGNGRHVAAPRRGNGMAKIRIRGFPPA
jgi:hypothetical protein